MNNSYIRFLHFRHTLSQRLRQLCYGHNNSLINVPYLANQLNVSACTLHRWLNGTSVPSKDNLVSISKYFNVSLEWLISGSLSTEENTPIVYDAELELHKLFAKLSSKKQRAFLDICRSLVCWLNMQIHQK